MAEDSVVIACSRICKYFISVAEKVMNKYVGKPHTTISMNTHML